MRVATSGAVHHTVVCHTQLAQGSGSRLRNQLCCQASQQQQKPSLSQRKKAKQSTSTRGKGFSGKEVTASREVLETDDSQPAGASPGGLATGVGASRAPSGNNGDALPQVSRSRIFWSCVQTCSGLGGVGLVLRQFGALPASELLGTHTAATDSLLAGPQLGEPSHWVAAAGVGVGVTAARQVLLAVWPDFAAASKRANEQVLGPLQWYDLLWVGGLPGISEELLFRGALIPATAADWRGVLIAGAVFGALHNSGGRNWAFAAWATVVGAAYGAAFLATGDVAVPMGAHVLSNVAGGILYQRLGRSAH